jgi:hypothetical protein
MVEEQRSRENKRLNESHEDRIRFEILISNLSANLLISPLIEAWPERKFERLTPFYWSKIL